MAKEPEETDQSLKLDEDGAEQSAPAAAPAPQRSGMLAVIIAGFLVMLLTPLITFFVVKQTMSTVPDKPPKQDNQRRVATFSVDPIVVNIEGTHSTRFLRFVPHLVVSDTRLLDEFRNQDSLVKDRILSAVGGKTLADLEGAKGREELKKEIMARINPAFSDLMRGVVVDVYFSEYLIQ